MNDPANGSTPRSSRWRQNAVFAAFATVAGFYLYTEHQAHLLGALPWLLLLACPLMHVFMHRGHHHHGAHGEGRRPTDSSGDR